MAVAGQAIERRLARAEQALLPCIDRKAGVAFDVARELAVTAADIQAAAIQTFRPDNRVVLTYVPRETEEQAA